MATLSTPALAQYILQKIRNRQPLVFDEIIFANISGLNANNLQNHLAMPSNSQIMHRQAVSQVGFVNENAVVYSVTLGTEVGNFNFNFIGLINRAENVLAVAVQTDPIQKIKNQNNQQGNSITRSILLEFNGAKSATNITIPAQTWQIDFTARLRGLDEKIRLTNLDLYGDAAFFGDGFLVRKSSTARQYTIEAGTGYIKGIRATIGRQTLNNQNLPSVLYADVVHHATVTGDYQTTTIVSSARSTDYVDSAGNQHYVMPIARIENNGNVTDLRKVLNLAPKKITADTRNEMDKDGHTHEIERAGLTQAGITALSNEVNSTAEDKAATPRAIKTVNDKVDALTQGQAGYIPNSKKSNAVDSNSADTVATSAAVKNVNDRVSNLDDTVIKNSGHQTINNGSLQINHTGNGNWSHLKLGTMGGYWQWEVNPNDSEKRFNFRHTQNGKHTYLDFPTLSSNGETVAYRSWVEGGYVSKSGDRMTGHLEIKSGAYSRIGLINNEDKQFIVEVMPENANYFGSFIYRNAAGSNEAKIDVPKKTGTMAIVSETVNKDGDEMTGLLHINTSEPRVHGKKSGNHQWYIGSPAANTDNVRFYGYRWGTFVELQQNAVATNREIVVNGHEVHHNGKNYVTVKTTNSNLAGLNIIRTGTSGSWFSRIEALSDKSWKFLTESGYSVLIPARNGTVALAQEVVSKSGDRMTGHLEIKSGAYSRIGLINNEDKQFIVEVMPENANYFGSFIYRNAAGSNEAKIDVPKKTGTIALKSDIDNVLRSNKSRTERHPRRTRDSYTTNGSVTVYPDGRIVQIFHLVAIHPAWFDLEVEGLGLNGERHRNIPIQLWTAMPNKIEKVHAQLMTATSGNTTTYRYEAAEWSTAWQLRDNLSTKNLVNINAARVSGGEDEPVDLYVVVEGY